MVWEQDVLGIPTPLKVGSDLLLCGRADVLIAAVSGIEVYYGCSKRHLLNYSLPRS